MKKLLLIIAIVLVLATGCANRDTKVTPAPTSTPAGENIPTVDPTGTPTVAITKAPTNTPTTVPTNAPTNTPTTAPTKAPTNTPTTAPTNTPEPTKNPDALFTAQELPIIDGATATAPFYEAIVGSLLGLTAEEGKAYCLCSTTTQAYINLMNGTVDMVVGAKPSKEQEAEAAAKGVEFEYYQVLSGGFVFFVNTGNPVDGLTQQQIKDIYTGKITNWKDVGGKDEKINAFQREEGSGSQTGLYRFVAPKEEIMAAPRFFYYPEMSGIVDAIASYDNGPGAIGYSYYYYVANMYYQDYLKLLKIDGIAPNNETIGNGTYPYTNETIVAVRKGTPKDSAVFKVIDYMLSDKGAKIADELGYVVVKK